MVVSNLARGARPNKRSIIVRLTRSTKRSALAMLSLSCVPFVTLAVVSPNVEAGTPPGVEVTGAVAVPATYTPTQLAAMPQQSLPVVNPGRGPHAVTGVPLEDVVVKSMPRVSPGTLSTMRVILTVTGRAQREITFALAELDPTFGAHSALLTTRGTSVSLIVPGDRNRTRSVSDVTSVRVAVSKAGIADVARGSVRVVGPHRSVVLTKSELNRLPAQTLSVTFRGPTGKTETHAESGPPLALVLSAAGVDPQADRPVVAVGSDDYGAAVTPAEASVGGKKLIVSTAEDGAALALPELVVGGDIAGARSDLHVALAGAVATADATLLGIVAATIASLRAGQGAPDAAAVVLGAGHAVRGAADAHHPDVARLTAQLRRALGDRFSGRYEQGRDLARPAATALLTSELAAADRLGWS